MSHVSHVFKICPVTRFGVRPTHSDQPQFQESKYHRHLDMFKLIFRYITKMYSREIDEPKPNTRIMKPVDSLNAFLLSG